MGTWVPGGGNLGSPRWGSLGSMGLMDPPGLQWASGTPLASNEYLGTPGVARFRAHIPDFPHNVSKIYIKLNIYIIRIFVNEFNFC